ncbi:uncharacterized protein BX664DRAFT_107027 [Halteromyces radiatus]|uniref:uncharacterized protein n=1 Tax=Halteromyces radiatus TaxID=101107 RepID=UPI0022212871|nr:uncharacterized protein BX664DRAFT_107027 [Halteromyces radiatus]KAI8093424.1 hypothetical protein BX664DRAFT_107027 [Halteromyces radiatus]
MDLFSILWQFICLWSGIYILVFIAKFYSKTISPRRKVSTTTPNILPTHAEDSELEEGQPEEDIIHLDEWHIQLFQIRFTTQRLNSLFGRWARLCPTFWKWWFSLGVIVGAIAMISGILIMIIAAFQILNVIAQALFTTLSTTNNNNNNNNYQRWVKRDIEPEQVEEQNDQLFLPMDY